MCVRLFFFLCMLQIHLISVHKSALRPEHMCAMSINPQRAQPINALVAPTTITILYITYTTTNPYSETAWLYPHTHTQNPLKIFIKLLITNRRCTKLVLCALYIKVPQVAAAVALDDPLILCKHKNG